MARLALIVTFFFCAAAFADDNPLLGTWQFMSIRYKGQEQPRPNPDLILTLEFSADGVADLKWHRENEPGFCERKAHYSFADGNLTQETFWINPGNSPECGKDPDMQPNKKTVTPARLANGRFETDFNLDTDPLTYLWEKEKLLGEKSGG